MNHKNVNNSFRSTRGCGTQINSIDPQCAPQDHSHDAIVNVDVFLSNYEQHYANAA